MRAALWFLALFGTAVAVALFAGNNQSTITVFWPPYRVDLSLNLVILLLSITFATLHLALKALSALFAIPGHARAWRIQHHERAVHMAFLDAFSHLAAGRFIRARKSAELVLVRESAMTRSGETLAYSGRLRALSHLLAAESAQALQDTVAREAHFVQAMEHAHQDAQGTREGIQLRAARWALEGRDAQAALRWLDELPQGAARRTIALRLRLKAARMNKKTGQALETARLLAKHRAFTEIAAKGILRSLALELIGTAHDSDQLQAIWLQLEPSEQLTPEIAIEASRRLLMLGGDLHMGGLWLLPIWDRMGSSPHDLSVVQRLSLVQVLDHGFSQSTTGPDAAWLSRIEKAQMANPGDPILQYLAGVTCMYLQLWGKAQQLLKQALPRLQDSHLQHRTWKALAELAERRGDLPAATQAWKNAVTLTEV
jgi:HemY protein